MLRTCAHVMCTRRKPRGGGGWGPPGALGQSPGVGLAWGVQCPRWGAPRAGLAPAVPNLGIQPEKIRCAGRLHNANSCDIFRVGSKYFSKNVERTIVFQRSRSVQKHTNSKVQKMIVSRHLALQRVQGQGVQAGCTAPGGVQCPRWGTVPDPGATQ